MTDMEGTRFPPFYLQDVKLELEKEKWKMQDGDKQKRYQKLD